MPWGTPIEKGQHISPATEFRKGQIPWNRLGQYKKCDWPSCHNQIWVPPSHIRKFCGFECRSLNRSLTPNPNKGKIIQKLQNENNPIWKGDKVGYNALHSWVARKLGKPGACEHCNKSRLSGRQIHWANKSHEYKRDLNDWIRLCVDCHAKYDLVDRRRSK